MSNFTKEQLSSLDGRCCTRQLTVLAEGAISALGAVTGIAAAVCATRSSISETAAYAVVNK